jgi:hypothetical protein
MRLRLLAVLANVAAVASVVVGCSAPTQDEDGTAAASAISGSHPDTSRAGSVGQLLVQKVYEKGKAGPNNYCTVAVIAPRVLLTSSACFEFGSFLWSTQEVPLQRTDLDGAGDWSVQAAFAPGPKMEISELLAPNVSAPTIIDGSVAVVQLTKDIPGLVPLQLAEAPSNGTRIFVWGYGCDRGVSYGTLRTRPLDWGEWQGFFGTDFYCSQGDTGATMLDREGNLVGLATPKGDVVPLTRSLLDAIRSRMP